MDRGRGYDAFMSYSHAADGKLAPAVQRALERFAKPWYRRRAASVFRDRTGLAVTEELWPMIERAIKSSRTFILMASPESARSTWVAREVACRLASGGGVLIVVTGGAIAWSDEQNDFDWTRTNCLPPGLRGAFRSQPLYLDLSWAKVTEDFSPTHPRFLDGIAELAAALHDIPKDEIASEAVRQHRRTMRIAWAAISTLVVLLAASVVASVVALEQRAAAIANAERASTQQKRAESEKTRAESEQKRAELEKNRAEDALEESKRQELLAKRNADLATKNEAEAKKQEQAAIANLDQARRNQREAEKQTKLAQEQREIARHEQRRAEEQKHRADEQRDIAEQQRKEAESQRVAKEKEAEKARLAALEATRQRDQAETRLRALQSHVALDRFETRGHGLTAVAMTLEASAPTLVDHKPQVHEIHDVLVKLSLQMMRPGPMSAKYEGGRSTLDRTGLLLARSNDRDVTLWDTATGQKIVTVDPTNAFANVEFTRDSEYLIITANSLPGRLSIFDVKQRSLRRLDPKKFEHVVSIADDGKTMLVRLDQGRGAGLVDIATGQLLRTFGQTCCNWSMSRSGTRVIAEGSLWDARTGVEIPAAFPSSFLGTKYVVGADGADTLLLDLDGKQLASLPPAVHPLGYSRTAISPDDRFIVRQSYTVTRLYEIAAGREVTIGKGSDLNRPLMFSPNSERLLFGTDDGLFVLSVEHPERTTRIAGCDISGGDPNTHVAFSPDDAVIALACEGTTGLWDTLNGQRVAWIDEYSPDLSFGGRQLLATGVRGLRVYPLDGGRLARPVGVPITSAGVGALSRDGKRGLREVGGKLVLVDTETQRSQTVTEAVTTTAPSFSPDGRQFAAPISPTQVGVFDALSGKLVLRIEPSPSKLGTIVFADLVPGVFSKNKMTAIASIARDNEIIWSATTGRVVVDFARKRVFVDGKSVDYETFIKPYKGRVKLMQSSLRNVQDAGELLDVTPNGTCIAARGAKVTAFRDCLTSAKAFADVTDTSIVISATLSDDQRHLVTASESALTLWDLESKQRLGTYGGIGKVSRAAFRGEVLVVLTDRGLYQLPFDERSVLSFACRVLRGKGEVPDMTGERLMKVQNDCLQYAP